MRIIQLYSPVGAVQSTRVCCAVGTSITAGVTDRQTDGQTDTTVLQIASHRYGYNCKMPARKQPQRLMGAGFAYRDLGILRYSRRHVIGELRRPASA